MHDNVVRLLSLSEFNGSYCFMERKDGDEALGMRLSRTDHMIQKSQRHTFGYISMFPILPF